ncbi:MAG: restriction endonuclease [Oscillospiraceae bacterium]|nr:restriction endonuclease [Oscillospiraceae bacterium]
MKKIMPQSGVPNYSDLINPTLKVLQSLGGSGKNDEIYDEVIKLLNLPDSAIDVPHGEGSQSELEYRLAWARTYLKKYGAIDNSARAVWSVASAYMNVEELDINEVIRKVKSLHPATKTSKPVSKTISEVNESEFPDEIKPWRKKLYDILINMDSFAFERLSQRLLRESGFTHVVVTKKSGDGGIDGFGKLKINGIFSFNIAFQCKRYKDSSPIGSPAIRDFRGSLTSNIEKAIFITTSTFSKAAKAEASEPGKLQIDLMEGEEFISKLAECGIGVKEVKDYEIDENYFATV